VKVSWVECSRTRKKASNSACLDWRGGCNDFGVRLFLLMVVLLGCVPATATAVTIDEVVALSKSGVSEQVIVAVIERDQTLFTLSPALIMKLQRDGLSDRILLALIKSGRPNEPPLAASPVAAVAAPVPPPPAIAVVGHGPQLPNTSEFDSMAADATEAPPLPVPPPVFVPVPIVVPVLQANPHAARRSRQRPEQYLERTANPQLCVDRVPLGPSPFSAALTRVTECPAVTQRYRAIR
jgi:hypothetical protein